MIPIWQAMTHALLWKFPKLLQIGQFNNNTESFELIAK